MVGACAGCAAVTGNYRPEHVFALRHFRSQLDACLAIFDIIEGWYNPRRRHSALAYLSPPPMRNERYYTYESESSELASSS
jgi:transposase InsO family protein